MKTLITCLLLLITIQFTYSNPKTDSLRIIAQKNYASDNFKLKKAATELIEIGNYHELGTFYLALSNFLERKGDSADKLEEAVESLKSNSQSKLKLNTLILILYHHYNSNKFIESLRVFEKIIKELNLNEKYYGVTEFSKEIKLIIKYGFISNNYDVNINEDLTIFKEAINNSSEDSESNHLFYLKYSLTKNKFYNKENNKLLKELYTECLKESKYLNAITIGLTLGKQTQNKKEKITLYLSLIELSKKTGITRYLDNLYGQLAEVYLEEKDFKKANSYYNEILKGATYEPTNLAMYAWTLFKINKNNNKNQSLKLLKKALNLTDNKDRESKLIIYNKLKEIALYNNDLKKPEIYQNKINELKSSQISLSPNKTVFLEKILSFNEKNKKLDNLELSNQYLKDKLKQRNLLFFTLFVLLFLTVISLINHRKKAFLMNKIEKTNSIIITQNKNLEFVFKEIENSNKYLHSYNHIAAHDIRNPLITIFGYSEILHKKLKNTISDEERTKLLEINTKSKNLSDTISELLKFPTINFTKEPKELINLNTLFANYDNFILDEELIENSQIKIINDLKTINAKEVQIEELIFYYLKLAMSSCKSLIIEVEKDNQILKLSIKNKRKVAINKDCLEYTFFKRIARSNNWTFSFSENVLKINIYKE